MSRLVAIYVILLSALCIDADAAEQGQRERAFVRGLELFDQAKSPAEYRESAAVFESILSDGFQNGAVYYNAGNAYYRAGDYGRAILNYRKAKLLRPRDTYLNANLQQALATAPGHLAEAPAPWWNHVLFWTEWLSYRQKVQLFFVGWSLLAVATTTTVAFRIRRMSWPLIATAVILIFIGVDCWLSDQQVNHSRRAVITGETIARKGIGESYEPAFDQPLRDGAEFQVLSVTTDWTFGHFEGIGDGWVPNDFVAR